jgi:hypothetical protein
VDRDAVDRWLQAYVDAWKTYDPDKIAALFTQEVTYRYHPYDAPIEGRDAVVRSWLGDSDAVGASTRDDPDTYDATYRTVAVDDDVAVAVGSTHYSEASASGVEVFDNCFVMRFDPDGVCSDFTEWYIKRPSP